MVTTPERPHQLKILLSEEEKGWLDSIAARRGITASDVIRTYIREARPGYAERLEGAHRRLATAHAEYLERLDRLPAAAKLPGSLDLEQRINDLKRFTLTPAHQRQAAALQHYAKAVLIDMHTDDYSRPHARKVLTKAFERLSVVLDAWLDEVKAETGTDR